MNVFMTGASGWIGSAVVPELLTAGHSVRGLARSERSAAVLRAAGVEPVAGDLDQLDVLRTAAEAADAVIHLANKHDWSDLAATNRAERAAVQTFCDALEDSGKPFLLASGTAIPVGHTLTELDANPASGPDAPRGGTEALAIEYATRGVRSVALRFAPSVHGAGGDHGFLALLVQAARDHGAAGYVGDGSNRWTAVNRLDAAGMVALALEKATPGSAAHAAAEVLTTRQIAEAIGATLGVPTVPVAPEAVAEHFGWLGPIFAMDLPASADLTRERLGWVPTHPTLAEDLAAGAYTS
ncbi:MAG: 3-beta hydroxysteroid dehydrogenase [Actinobacteria bacterium HGW-Actinobacteria-5]|nr:MAG: 3-beta hydroxysteroid dehydrogenase [Actinobacteria bacterium HGW-Actinobacteria-5]